MRLLQHHTTGKYTRLSRRTLTTREQFDLKHRPPAHASLNSLDTLTTETYFYPL